MYSLHFVLSDKSYKALLHPDIDLVLLDVMLPDGNGYDFCRYIREHDNYVPVIFLTAVSDEVNLVQGLELGADDYIAKPYRVKELLTRIAVILRRQKYNSDTKEKKEETEFARCTVYISFFLINLIKHCYTRTSILYY